MKTAILCLTACVVACYLNNAEAITITRPCHGLTAAALVPLDGKKHVKSSACKICEFPCLGLSICLTPMLDSRHPTCSKHSIPTVEYDPHVRVIKERIYHPRKHTQHIHSHIHEESVHVGAPKNE